MTTATQESKSPTLAKPSFEITSLGHNDYQINLTEHNLVCLKEVLRNSSDFASKDLMKLQEDVQFVFCEVMKARPDLSLELIVSMKSLNEILLSSAIHSGFVNKISNSLDRIEV